MSCFLVALNPSRVSYPPCSLSSRSNRGSQGSSHGHGTNHRHTNCCLAFRRDCMLLPTPCHLLPCPALCVVCWCLMYHPPNSLWGLLGTPWLPTALSRAWARHSLSLEVLLDYGLPRAGAEAAAGAAKAQALEGEGGGTSRPGGWLWELVGDLGSLLSHPVYVLTMLGATAYIGMPWNEADGLSCERAITWLTPEVHA